ncbi:MAG: hypothetical protein WDN28_33760 [Chthoniobacter sp.]
MHRWIQSIAPLEAIVFDVTGKHRFDAARFHQCFKIGNGLPASGTDADARNAESISDLDALLGEDDPLVAFGGVRRDEILEDRQADQIHAAAQRVPLEVAAVDMGGGVERPSSSIPICRCKRSMPLTPSAEAFSITFSTGIFSPRKCQ